MSQLSPDPVSTVPLGISSAAKRKRLPRRRLLLVVLVLVFGGGLALAGPVPEAFAQKAGPSEVRVFALITLPKKEDPEAYRKTQVVLFKSRFVLGAALKQPEVAALTLVKRRKDPVAWLEKAIQVDFGKNTGVLGVSMVGANADELVVLVNAVTDSYVVNVVKREGEARKDRIEKLNKIKADFEGLLNRVQEDLRGAMKKEPPPVKIDVAGVQMEIDRLRKIRGRVAQEIKSLKAELRAPRPQVLHKAEVFQSR
jgi:hypothetical protein